MALGEVQEGISVEQMWNESNGVTVNESKDVCGVTSISKKGTECWTSDVAYAVQRKVEAYAGLIQCMNAQERKIKMEVYKRCRKERKRR